jgi:hypothetical protein
MTPVPTRSALAAVALAACAQPAQPPPSTLATEAAGKQAAVKEAAAPPDAAEPRPERTAPAVAATAPTAAAVFARLERDLMACYTRGKVAPPEMNDGKLTLLAAIADGKTSCVIPTDDRGFTQEVEDCMAARIARESHEPGARGSLRLPLVLRAGKLALAEGKDAAPILETVETTRMPDAFDVIEDLIPKFEGCISGPKRGKVVAVVAGARVSANGSVDCALATSYGDEAPDVDACAATVLRGAQFRPPKRAPGLVLVPIRLGTVR